MASDRKKAYSIVGCALILMELLQLAFSHLYHLLFDSGSVPYYICSWIFFAISILLPSLIICRYIGTSAPKFQLSPRFSLWRGASLMCLVIVLSLAVTTLLDALGLESLYNSSLPQGAAELILSAVTSIIVAPILEELFFRGVVLQSLLPFGERTAILFCAASFALAHHSLYNLAAPFLAGCVFGVFSQRYGFWSAVMLHSLNNAVAFAGLLGIAKLNVVLIYLILAGALASLFGLHKKSVSLFAFFAKKEHPRSPLDFFSVPLLIFYIYSAIKILSSVSF